MSEETNHDYKIKEQKYSVHEKIMSIKETKMLGCKTNQCYLGNKILFCGTNQNYIDNKKKIHGTNHDYK
jgi:hypothetical protein